MIHLHHSLVAMQEEDWNRLSQISSLEESYAEKRKELTTAAIQNMSHESMPGSHDQKLKRDEVDQVTKQLLGNMIDMAKKKIELNMKGQQLTVDLVTDKIKILTNRQQGNSLPPSQKSTYES